MRTWWTGLNMRERWLVGLAAALSAIILIWQAVLMPVLNTKAGAKGDLAAASEQLDLLLEGYSRKRMEGGLSGAGANGETVLSMDAFKGAVTRDAAAKGLSISRLQGDDEASVILVFERVQPQQLFYWLQAVETEFGGRVSRMTLEQAGEGAVRASLELEQAGS